MEPKIIVEFTEQEARDTIQAYEATIKSAPSSLNVAQIILPLATKVQLALDQRRTTVPAVSDLKQKPQKGRKVETPGHCRMTE
jgi:hypothetical protein